MKTVGVADLKSGLSAHLASVKAGEELLVTDRGRPLARIVPISGGAVPPNISELARRGLVKLPGHKPEKVAPRVKDPGRQLLSALLEERHRGR